MKTTQRLTLAGLALANLACATMAEIVSVTGDTSIEVAELIDGSPANTLSQTDSYPSSASSLPLQTIGQLVASTEDAAASLGAQFAEPNFPGATFDDPNAVDPNAPSDFAISIGLGSDASDIAYDGFARVVATRTVRFSEGELGDQPAGATVDLIGSVQLEGALTILADSSGQDLSSAAVTLDVWVNRRAVGSDASTRVMEGTIELAGDSGGGVTVTATGDIPTGALSRNDLTLLAPEFAIFEVLIIPAIQVEYAYQADVGETFVLETIVEVSGYCPGGGAVVGAIIGAPYDVLVDVISVVEDQQAAQTAQTLVLGEIAEPTGEAAFPAGRASETDCDCDAPAAAALSVCGPLGFASVLGLTALCLLSGRRRARQG